MCYNSQLNPQGTVPTLNDNGRGICDSHAISTYLIGKYGKTDDPLYPRDLYIRAKVDERLHFDNGVLFAALKDIYWPFLFDGACEIAPKAFKSTYKAYDLLETFLEVDPFFVGQHLTVADLSIGTILTHMALMIPISDVKYPKLLQWISRLEELPYFIEINTKPLESIIAAFREMIEKRKAAAEVK